MGRGRVGLRARSVLERSPNRRALCLVDGAGPEWGIAGFACKNQPPSLLCYSCPLQLMG